MRFTVALGKTNYLKQSIHPKTYSLDLYSTLNQVSFPPRTRFKPCLTVRKPINSPVLSPTLLQIYCIGLISYYFWVWSAICDLTISFASVFGAQKKYLVALFFKKLFGYTCNTLSLYFLYLGIAQLYVYIASSNYM